jgi:hypothetical protein
MDTRELRAAAALLPEPGAKVVGECLDEIDRLEAAFAAERERADIATANVMYGRKIEVEQRERAEDYRLHADELCTERDAAVARAEKAEAEADVAEQILADMNSEHGVIKEMKAHLFFVQKAEAARNAALARVRELETYIEERRAVTECVHCGGRMDEGTAQNHWETCPQHPARSRVREMEEDSKGMLDEWEKMYAGRECPKCRYHVTMNVSDDPSKMIAERMDRILAAARAEAVREFAEWVKAQHPVQQYVLLKSDGSPSDDSIVDVANVYLAHLAGQG